jgi:predicted nucleic acid-binding protein
MRAAREQSEPLSKLLDTNILIDYFNGGLQAQFELAYYDALSISVITYIEFIAGLRKQAGLGF